mgnify:CR=1 FL=1
MDAAPATVPPSLSLETLWEEDSRQRGGSGVYPVRGDGRLLGVDLEGLRVLDELPGLLNVKLKCLFCDGVV